MTRELEWDGCLNVRDLGGVPLPGGGETRRGVLVRSDNIRQLTESGWRALAAHGVVRIVDLRWPEELADDEPPGVDIDVVHVSLLGELDPEYRDDIDAYMAAEDPAGYWAESYTSMLEEYREHFGDALGAIAAVDGPVVFHCAAGKDRTGLIAALLLRLAGVSVAEVARDYSLTFDMLERGPRAWVNEVEGRAWERRMFMQHTPPGAMERALAGLEERYGDVEGYLRACGLVDEQIDRLRARLAPA